MLLQMDRLAKRYCPEILHNVPRRTLTSLGMVKLYSLPSFLLVAG
jgi:hypothetical protein